MELPNFKVLIAFCLLAELFTLAENSTLMCLKYFVLRFKFKLHDILFLLLGGSRMTKINSDTLWYILRSVHVV